MLLCSFARWQCSHNDDSVDSVGALASMAKLVACMCCLLFCVLGLFLCVLGSLVLFVLLGTC